MQSSNPCKDPFSKGIFRINYKQCTYIIIHKQQHFRYVVVVNRIQMQPDVLVLGYIYYS
jgi:hypothetical protein